MTTPGPFAAVILDFDGTMIDTEWSEYVTVRDEFRRHTLDYPLARFQAKVGRADGVHWTEELIQDLGPEHGIDPDRIDTMKARRRQAHHDMIAASEIRPGILELIDRATASAMALAVASSSPANWVERHLADRHLLHRFAAVATGDRVRRGKPWPDVFLDAARRLDIAPDRCLVIEDSHNGVAAAKAAGMHCVAVPNPVTTGTDLSAADLVLDSVGDLPWADYGL